HPARRRIALADDAEALHEACHDVVGVTVAEVGGDDGRHFLVAGRRVDDVAEGGPRKQSSRAEAGAAGQELTARAGRWKHGRDLALPDRARARRRAVPALALGTGASLYQCPIQTAPFRRRAPTVPQQASTTMSTRSPPSGTSKTRRISGVLAWTA